MPRRFSTFPDGRLGAGLLLLRAAVGISLVVAGGSWSAGPAPGAWAGPPALAVGALLLIGFLTPMASALAALTGLGIAFAWLPLPLPTECKPAAFFLAVIAGAVFLLGPGAFSIDGRRFGRREVVIPRTRPPEG